MVRREPKPRLRREKSSYPQRTQMDADIENKTFELQAREDDGLRSDYRVRPMVP